MVLDDNPLLVHDDCVLVLDDKLQVLDDRFWVFGRQWKGVTYKYVAENDNYSVICLFGSLLSFKCWLDWHKKDKHRTYL